MDLVKAHRRTSKLDFTDRSSQAHLAEQLGVKVRKDVSQLTSDPQDTEETPRDARGGGHDATLKSAVMLILD